MKLEDAIKLYAPDDILHLYCRERYYILNTILFEPFDPDLHYTLTYIHLHYAMLEVAKIYLDYCPNKDDETYKELVDFYDALEEAQNGYSVFPLTVNYRNWWDGPHLIENKEGVTNWFPLRVEWIEGDEFFALVAKQENGEIVYGTSVKLSCNKTNVPPEPDMMGEVIFYNEEYKIIFHDGGKWVPNPALKIVQDRAWPYIQRSHDALQESINKLYQQDSDK